MARLKTNREGSALVFEKLTNNQIRHVCGDISRSALHQWDGVVPERYVLLLGIVAGVAPEDILPELAERARRLRAEILTDGGPDGQEKHDGKEKGRDGRKAAHK